MFCSADLYFHADQCAGQVGPETGTKIDGFASGAGKQDKGNQGEPHQGHGEWHQARSNGIQSSVQSSGMGDGLMASCMNMSGDILN